MHVDGSVKEAGILPEAHAVLTFAGRGYTITCGWFVVFQPGLVPLLREKQLESVKTTILLYIPFQCLLGFPGNPNLFNIVLLTLPS